MRTIYLLKNKKRFKEEYRMKKKLLGFMFAATMLFGASMTVFAADASGNNVTTVSGNSVIGGDDITMDADVVKPTLEVTITAGTKVIANPYGLTDAALGVSANDTLKGSTIEFENKSNTAISVGLTGKIVLPTYEGVSPAPTADQKVTVATSAPGMSTATKKQVYVQAEISNGAGKKLQNSTGSAAEKALVYSAAGAKMTNAPVLAAAGDTTEFVSNKMLLTLTGATSKSPTSEWTDADAFTVVTVYDFQFGNTAKLSKFK